MNEESKRKKQKAPLGIRPNDYIENKFKVLVKENNTTQTEMFEKIMWNFIHNSNEALKLQSLDCSVELQSIKAASSTLVKSINKIVSKAQIELISKNTEIESIKNISDKKIELANMDLKNRVKELELINKELENKFLDANSIVKGFNTVKDDMTLKIESHLETINNLNSKLKEKENIIKDNNKELFNKNKYIENLEKELSLLKNENSSLERNLASSQITLENYKSTIDNFNSIKISEIETVKESLKLIYELKIDKLKAEFEKEIANVKNNLSTLENDINLKEIELKNTKNSFESIIESKNLEIKSLKAIKKLK